MPKEAKVMAIISGGKLQMDDSARRYLAERVSLLGDRRVEVIVKPYHSKRSLQQNKFYWPVVVGMITDALQDLGNEIDAEGTHEFLKAKFNPKTITNPTTGELIATVGGSTAKMNKSEMMCYIDTITVWAAEFLGITIPPPDTQAKLFETYILYPFKP